MSGKSDYGKGDRYRLGNRNAIHLGYCRIFARPIPEFPGYRIMPDGTIYSEPKARGINRLGQILKPKLCGDHLQVKLFRNGQRIYRYVHQLVLETFVGARPKGLIACHNNGCSLNNDSKNLRWDSPASNNRDTFRHGAKSHKGTKNPAAKLNELQVRIIKKLLKRDILTQKEIGKIFNVAQMTISDINCDKTWGKEKRKYNAKNHNI